MYPITPPLNPHTILPNNGMGYELHIDKDAVDRRKKIALKTLENLPSPYVDFSISNNQNLNIVKRILTKRLTTTMTLLITKSVVDLASSFGAGIHFNQTCKDADDIFTQEHCMNYCLFRCINYLLTGFPVYDPTTDGNAPEIKKSFPTKLLEVMTEYTKADRDILSHYEKIAEQSLHLDYKIYTKALVSYKLDLMKQLKTQMKELGEDADKYSNPDIINDFDMPPLIPIATIPSEEPLPWHYAIKV
jgi:hypothetical protein